MNTKRIFLALIITGILVTGASAQSQEKRTGWAAWMIHQGQAAGAQTDQNRTYSDDQSSGDEVALTAQRPTDVTGSWLITVTTTGDGGPPLKAVATFTEDGGFIQSAQGDILLDKVPDLPPTFPPALTPGHGGWVRTGNRKFAMTFVQIAYGRTGEFMGTLKVRNTINLNESGNEWSGPFIGEVFDPDGKLVFSVTGTAQAKRIVVEPLP